MDNFLLWFLPVFVPVITPFVVAGGRWVGEYFGKVLPSTVTPIVAVAVGELLNQLSGLLTGSPLPPAVSGLIAIGVRETYDQLNKSKLRDKVAMGIGAVAPFLFLK